jgi:hypothetical protein
MTYIILFLLLIIAYNSLINTISGIKNILYNLLQNNKKMIRNSILMNFYFKI